MVFFLHIPFPTSQIFRALYCGDELLNVRAWSPLALLRWLLLLLLTARFFTTPSSSSPLHAFIQFIVTLPRQQQQHQGMLCADVIGFHAFDHARHFLNACKRILGVSYFNKSGCVPSFFLPLPASVPCLLLTRFPPSPAA